MANIIDSSFFNGTEISIPNTSQANVLEQLNGFITKYEKECLVKILGYPLYVAFIENRADQRMVDLLEGVRYQLNGKLAEWQGLVHDTNISLIANYIYWFFQASNATHSTGTATAKVNPSASISVSPGEKMLSAWSWMSSEVSSLILFLRNQKLDGVRVYPEFDWLQESKTKNIFRPVTLL